MERSVVAKTFSPQRLKTMNSMRSMCLPRTRSWSLLPSPFGVKVFGTKMSGPAQSSSYTFTSTDALRVQIPSLTATVKRVVACTSAVGSAMVGSLSGAAGDQL